MSDGNLMAFGCAVTFVALAGAYVYLREHFSAGVRKARDRNGAERRMREAA